MTSDQRRALELISIAEGGASLDCSLTDRGDLRAGDWLVRCDDAITIVRPDGSITDYAELEYELSPEGRADRRERETEPPDLLPELHDVPLTDLDTDRDTERRAEERDRRWEELNARD